MPSLHLKAAFTAAPRYHLFTTYRIAQTGSRRFLSGTAPVRKDDSPYTSFGSGPSPPRLPKEDQEIFEALQRQSTGAFSTPRSPPKIAQSPHSSPSEASSADSEIERRAQRIAQSPDITSPSSSESPIDATAAETRGDEALRDEFDRRIKAQGDGQELHPNVRRGAEPEFDGDTNPKTGEVGGPKNEPLRWGAAGEWSYNGRTTDF